MDPGGIGLISRTDTRPQGAGFKQVTHTYDGLNRVTGKTYNDGTPAVSYFYDGLGVTGATNAKGRQTKVVSTLM